MRLGRGRALGQAHDGERHEEGREEAVDGEERVERPLEPHAGPGSLSLEEGDELVFEFGALGLQEVADEEGEGLLVGGGVAGGAEETRVGRLGPVLGRRGGGGGGGGAGRSDCGLSAAQREGERRQEGREHGRGRAENAPRL